jgi:hypothetical protein
MLVLSIISMPVAIAEAISSDWGFSAIVGWAWRDINEYLVNIWGQMKNYFLFGLGPLRNVVTRRPDSCSISCLNLSFPNAIP